jgi:predicted Zn-dependent peptidase
MTVERTALPNGVTIVSERVPWLASVTAGILVPSGSRDEGHAENGVAHFIEHLIFKGTTRRTALDIAREIESVGGTLNACTEREYTFVHGRALGRDFPLLADVLSDLILDPLFDPEELERERGVILQEILMVEDTPEEFLHDYFQEACWPYHSLGQPIQGSCASVEGLDRERVLAAYRRMYRREGIIVAVVSPLEHGRVVDEFAHRFASLALLPPPSRPRAPEIRTGSYFRERHLGQLHVCLGLPAPTLRDPDRYEATVLNTILGGSMSSLLFQEVREKRGMAYSIYSSLSLYADAGILKICAGTTSDRAKELMEVTTDVVARVARGDFPDDEVSLAREQLKGGLLLSMESPEYRLSRIALNELVFERDETPEEVLGRLDAVTPEGVRELASRLLRKDRFLLAAVGDLPVGGDFGL